MTNPARTHWISPVFAVALLGLAGCSDQSRYVMNVTKIAPTAAPTVASMSADLVGNIGVSPCSVVQDLAAVTIRVEHPGSLDIGPALGAYLTGYRIDYYYYDPITGVLSGPIAFLTSSMQNMRIPAGVHGTGNMTVTIDIPVATFGLKAWSVGALYNNNLGYAGAVPNAVWVERVVARFTIAGEDTTGKKLSAEGSMLLYLRDYGPGPTAPTLGAALTSENWCSGLTSWTYWGNFGGVQP